jgi:hypothetical protein
MQHVLAAMMLVAAAILESSSVGAQSASTERVSLPGVVDSAAVRLPATLYRPEGSGPFPAVVLVHGCVGIESYSVDWAVWVHEARIRGVHRRQLGAPKGDGGLRAGRRAADNTRSGV